LARLGIVPNRAALLDGVFDEPEQVGLEIGGEAAWGLARGSAKRKPQIGNLRLSANFRGFPQSVNRP
jgi:hypothetical protein